MLSVSHTLTIGKLVKSLGGASLLLLALSVISCGVSPPTESIKPTQIRLSQIWDAQDWQSIAALNQRGPLSVLIAKEDDLKELKLESIPWIRADIIDLLALQTTINLKQQRQTKKYPIVLDGMKESLKLSFTALNRKFFPYVTQRYDLIIPYQSLFPDCLEQDLEIDNKGYLVVMKSKKNLIDPPKKHEAKKQSMPQWLNRYQDIWDVQKAFPSLIVAQRVDHKDEVEIRWFPPTIPLPTDLWIVTSSDFLNPAQGEKFVVHIRSPKSYLAKPIQALRFSITTEKRQKKCTTRQPCTLYLQDVMRVSKKCLHDLCTQRLSDFGLNVLRKNKMVNAD